MRPEAQLYKAQPDCPPNKLLRVRSFEPEAPVSMTKATAGLTFTGN